MGAGLRGILGLAVCALLLPQAAGVMAQQPYFTYYRGSPALYAPPVGAFYYPSPRAHRPPVVVPYGIPYAVTPGIYKLSPLATGAFTGPLWLGWNEPYPGPSSVYRSPDSGAYRSAYPTAPGRSLAVPTGFPPDKAIPELLGPRLTGERPSQQPEAIPPPPSVDEAIPATPDARPVQPPVYEGPREF